MTQPVPIHSRSPRASERHIPSSRDCNSSRSDRLSIRSEWHTRLRGASCPRYDVPLAGVAQGSAWPRPEPVLVESLESTQRNVSGMSTWTALARGIRASRPVRAPESVQRCAICDTGCDTLRRPIWRCGGRRLAVTCDSYDVVLTTLGDSDRDTSVGNRFTENEKRIHNCPA